MKTMHDNQFSSIDFMAFGPWECRGHLVPCQLLIELLDIWIPLGLVVVGSYQLELILGCEVPDAELAPAVAGGVGEPGLVGLQAAGLLVREVHVAVQACALWRP